MDSERLLKLDFSLLPTVLTPLLEGIEACLAGKAAEKEVDRLLRAHRSFDSAQRRVFVECLYAVALWRRRLEWHAGSRKPRALVWALLRELAGVSEGVASALLQWEGPVPNVVPPPESPAIRFSFPDGLFSALERDVGREVVELAQALNLPGPVCVRVNRLKTTLPALQSRLRTEGVETEKGHWAADCLRVTSEKPNIFGLLAYQEGLFEVQDEGSQVLGELLLVKPHDTVLDLCAGAGGKTLQLASLMQNQGILHAFDVDEQKLQRLRLRAKRAGARNVQIHSQLPEGLKVSRCLVDAPCSEWGALRRGPDRRFLMAESDDDALPSLQRSLLEQALTHLLPGGRLAYATCTWRFEENEGVVAPFEKAHPELRRLFPDNGRLADSMRRDGYFRSYPHRHGTDGFFAAVYELCP